MVMIDCNAYMNSLANKYSNVLGHVSDHEEPMANSHSKVMNEEFDEVLPCTCDECVKEFLTGMDPVFDGEDETPEEYLAESIDEAATEVVENLAFLGDGTSSRDVMIAILSLEAAIAQVKIYLLETE